MTEAQARAIADKHLRAAQRNVRAMQITAWVDDWTPAQWADYKAGVLKMAGDDAVAEVMAKQKRAA